MDLSGATILLTGGTGSFGNAFVERMSALHPDVTIRIYSRDELKQSQMQQKFAGHRNLRFMIGDVRNKVRTGRAIKGADFVVHAAAMKQVPACEYNPFEAVQTNILGAQHVVDCSIDSGVQKVIGVSTDKAVNPVNLYGATKLCAEKIFVQGNAYSNEHTRLACVRYGNVVGSRGSVVPLFQKQAAEEGRITITDDRMTRFWIMLDEAVDLVLSAIEHTVGGETLIPKIPSMRVTDLAEAVAPGVPREVVGIRPGEKLHEVLLTSEEARNAVDAGDYYVVMPQISFWGGLDEKWASGKPLDEGFEYVSHTNDEWLTVDDLRDLVARGAKH